MIRTSRRRRGYALVLVLVFTVLFLSLLGVAWRRVASALCIASVRSLQVERDEGSVQALARGLHLLETGLPPANPYVCGVTIGTTRGLRSFTVTFTADGEATWTVHSSPTPPNDNPPLMPDSFAPPHA